MIRNYMVTAFRSFSRNKIYPILNILGLTAGIGVFIIICIYVQYEFSFDKYHQHKDRIYRVVKQDVDNFYMGNNHFGVTPAPLAPTLMAEFPEIEYATRFMQMGNRLIGVEDQSFLEPSIHATDPETFQIFTFTPIQGKLDNYLNEKNTAVLTESIAKKYFGDRDPIGQIIRYRDEHPFTITGVIEDMPKNSHFTMAVILDYTSVMEADNRDLTRWNNNSFYTYFLLREDADPKQLELKLPEIRDKYADDKLDEDGQETIFYLQEFSKIHLNSNVNFDIGPTNSKNRLYIYFLIAFLMLSIACINYINLATARAITRSREVGIRKVIGAHRRNLIGQFLGESFLLVFVALLIAVISAHMILPSFSRFVGLDFSINYLEQPIWLAFYLGLFILIGLASGAYPAFLLSSVQPISALTDQSKGRSGKSMLRNILVVTQFAISGILITCTLIVSEQMMYVQHKEMGYVRDQIAVLRIRDSAVRDKMSVFKDELRRIPGVTHVSSSSSLPNEINSTTGVNWPGKSEDVDISFYTASADHEFRDLFELEIAEGRWFDESMGDDKNSMLLNESAVNALGWENPIGKEMLTWSNDTAKVIGVIKDYHQHSLHLDIMPMQIFFGDQHYQVSIRIESEESQKVLTEIEELYSGFSQKFPFEYVFFDDVFTKAYLTELKTARLSVWATGLTILIACLGLYGLAMYTAEQRLKEIGIRKVLGATESGILYLLSRNFASLVFVAFLISIPVSYYFMSNWLQGFAFHIPMRIMDFIIALIAMIAIGGATISYRTILAARKNPVEILKEQ